MFDQNSSFQQSAEAVPTVLHTELRNSLTETLSSKLQKEYRESVESQMKRENTSNLPLIKSEDSLAQPDPGIKISALPKSQGRETRNPRLKFRFQENRNDRNEFKIYQKSQKSSSNAGI